MKEPVFFSFYLHMDDEYRTLDGPSQGIYREKGSRFMAFGFPLRNEEEVREIMGKLRREYHDARHYCYAYRIRTGEENVRYNDDGEPAGTGGRPIFQALQAAEVHDVLVVVVRYFGGILLGRNRLANAYRSAASDMFSHADIRTCYRQRSFRLQFPYGHIHDAMSILKEESISPVRPQYDNTCTMFVSIRESKTERVLRRLGALEGFDASAADDLMQENEDVKPNHDDEE